MSVERRWWSVHALSPLLAALLLTLAACDGGIFGTGDGSDVVISSADGNSPPMSPSGGEFNGDGDGGNFGEGENGAADGGTDGGGDDSGTGQPVPSATFSNTLDVGTGSVPRVRLVNASTLSVELVGPDGRPFAGSGVPPGASGALVELPSTIDELRLRRADEDGEAALLYRLVPVALSMSSVTTLIVRDTEAAEEPDRGVGVVVLETRLAPSDPAQALVRIVQGEMPIDPDEGETQTVYRLVPAGASPGGVEVTFDGIAFEDDPATPYRDVPAGDYRLEGSGQDGDEAEFSPLPVSIEPGSVHTFVIIDTESVIDVIDGPSGKR